MNIDGKLRLSNPWRAEGLASTANRRSSRWNYLPPSSVHCG